MQFDINSTVSITRTRLGILESSKNKTESARRRMFEAMAVRFICMSVVRRREVTSGYCHMGNIQSTITPLPHPFQLRPHVRRRPGHLKALEVAAVHRGTIGYAASNDIL